LGGRTRRKNSASTISVTMYGRLEIEALLIQLTRRNTVSASVQANSRQEKTALIGDQLPRISAARAMNLRPWFMPSRYRPTSSIDS
jgi:predicted aconitase